MDEKIGIKETEWSADKATLQRIDEAIRKIYNARLNIFGTNSNWVYLESLDILYGEGHVHFTKEELEECKNIWIELEKYIEDHEKDLFMPQTHSEDNQIINNYHFYSNWKMIKKIMRHYYLYLMRCLQNHNLLMKTAKSGLAKFRGM